MKSESRHLHKSRNPLGILTDLILQILILLSGYGR